MTNQDTSTIIRAMQNTDFMDFVESHDKSGRLEKACSEFFTEYHGNNPETQLTTINKLHLVSMWRFFVAYITGVKPYSLQMDIAFDNGCCEIWDTDNLKNFMNKKFTADLLVTINQYAKGALA